MNKFGHKVVVWDAATRLFHWVTVVLVIAAYWTWWMNWMDWHAWTGEAVLALVLFRVLWGFFGSETARFVAAPSAAATYIATILRRERDRQVGHNPAGGWMVLLLLALLLAEALTGLFVNNDVANEGPLTEVVPSTIANFITNLHLYFWNALFAAAILHVLAILLYACAKRQDLVTPMITGIKTLPEDIKQPQLAGAARAALLFGCGALATAALARFL
jgi:cytochrome b